MDAPDLYDRFATLATRFHRYADDADTQIEVLKAKAQQWRDCATELMIEIRRAKSEAAANNESH